MRITSAKQLRTALKRDVLLKALVDYIEITPGAQIKAVAGTALFVAEAPTIDGLVATWVVRAAGFTPDDLDTVLKAVQAKLGGEIQGNRLVVSQLATQELIDQAEAAARQQKQREEIASAVRKANAVKDGRDGIDGLRGERGPQGPQGLQGPPGRDGIDGLDLLATDASLFDLKDVEQGIQLDIGQVLTWNGTEWTNLFVPQLLSSISGGGGAADAGAPSTTIQWKYHIGTGEPPSRDFHTDNVDDPTLITILHVSDFNNAGNDVTSLLNGLLPNTDKIYLYKVDEPSSAHLYSVSSYTETATGYEITVSHIETPGGEPALVNNSVYGFTFITAGTGGGGGIGDLADVDTSTSAPTLDQALVWDNTSWVPGDVATLDAVRRDAENKTFGYTNGNLTSVTGAETQIAITYNQDGTVNTVAKTVNGVTITKTLGYDINGNLSTIVVS